MKATLAVAFCIGDSLFEDAVTDTTHPSPQTVREYLERRTHSEDPPPTPDEIRRELGWNLISVERQAEAEREERN